MPKYTVEQGDHIARIAEAFGIRSWQTIWDHPDNASLKGQRGNPNVLHPGDVVSVPERAERVEDCATEKRHRFRAAGGLLHLRLRVVDPAWAAVPNAAAILTVEATIADLKTDADGKLERALRPSDRAAQVRVDSPRLPMPIEGNITIGGLDPIDTVTGQIARLNNLGYDAGPVQEPATPESQTRLRSAIEEFQCDLALSVDGICGPNTQKKLKESHGC